MSRKTEKVLAKNLQASFKKHVSQVFLPLLDHVLYLLILLSFLICYFYFFQLLASSFQRPKNLNSKKKNTLSYPRPPFPSRTNIHSSPIPLRLGGLSRHQSSSVGTWGVSHHHHVASSCSGWWRRSCCSSSFCFAETSRSLLNAPP